MLLRIGIQVGLILLIGAVASVSLMNSGIGVAFALVVMFVMEWLYGGLLETLWNGQTVGKRVMGIRVLSVDGQPINGLQAMMRNILRFADMMPLIPASAIFDEPSALPIPTFVIGLVAPLLNNRFQRLGDIVCGTMVVIDEKSWLFEAAKLEDPRVAQLAAELPAGFNVSRTMARALATYVDRRQLFSPPRRREIARHIAEPLVGKFGLPADTSYDLLLCSLYHRTFLANEEEEVLIPQAYADMQKQMSEESRPHIPTGLPSSPFRPGAGGMQPNSPGSGPTPPNVANPGANPSGPNPSGTNTGGSNTGVTKL